MENISREVDYLSTESILSIRLLLLIEKLKSARDYGTSDCTEATEPDDEEEEEDDVEDQDSFIEVAEIVQTLLSSSFERYAASTISQESFSLETKGTVDEITTPTSTTSRPFSLLPSPVSVEFHRRVLSAFAEIWADILVSAFGKDVVCEMMPSIPIILENITINFFTRAATAK